MQFLFALEGKFSLDGCGVTRITTRSIAMKRCCRGTFEIHRNRIKVNQPNVPCHQRKERGDRAAGRGKNPTLHFNNQKSFTDDIDALTDATSIQSACASIPETLRKELAIK